jgi:hypothetical protein
MLPKNHGPKSTIQSQPFRIKAPRLQLAQPQVSKAKRSRCLPRRNLVLFAAFSFPGHCIRIDRCNDCFRGKQQLPSYHLQVTLFPLGPINRCCHDPGSRDVDDPSSGLVALCGAAAMVSCHERRRLSYFHYPLSVDRVLDINSVLLAYLGRYFSICRFQNLVQGPRDLGNIVERSLQGFYALVMVRFSRLLVFHLDGLCKCWHWREK